MTSNLENTDTQMDGDSLNISEQRKKELKQLFPNAFTETKNDQGDVVETLDFERLKAELGEFSEIYDNRRERYGMDWPGKRDCLRLIQEPSTATLKPCREESVDFDTTENLFIEGDNLEVLKLLQKSYYGKVKMIYIDPPYNTGKEFIYPDNYQESLETYLSYSGQVDEEGKKFSTNTAAEGRYHTNWLNMMYPRLYLARNLLRDDGVIFVSINFHEAKNLKPLLDDIFGEESLIFDVSVVNNLKGRNDREGIATCHEQVMIYCKPNYIPLGLPLSEDQISDYKEVDESGENFQWRDLRKRGGADTREERPKMFFPLYVDPESGEVDKNKSEKYSVEVLPTKSGGEDGCWRWGYEKATSSLHLLKGKKVANKDRWNISYRVYLKDGDDERRSTPKSFWNSPRFSSDSGTKSLASLFPSLDAKKFTPKAMGFLIDIIEQSTEDGDLILDFFSGTATSAVSLIRNNFDNKVNRKFIVVQLPEPIEDIPDDLSFISSISDLGKERIRRFGEAIKIEAENSTDLLNSKKVPDIGFKSLKLTQSNFKQWKAPDKDVSEEKLIEQLEFNVDHIDPNATQEDLLYELLIKAGVMPTESIEQVELANHTLFSVAEDSLLIHLDNEIDQDLIDAVIEKAPGQFICLDKAFHGNDQLKANAVKTIQAFNQGKDEVDRIDFKTV